MSREPHRSDQAHIHDRFDDRNRQPNHPNHPRSHTSWDAVARWYAGWTGADGSEYHRSLAIPTVLELMQPRPGETIADIGCGPGILSEFLSREIRYIGIDASPRLLETARRRARGRSAQTGKRRPDRTFVLADAANLAANDNLRPGTADGAVFMLSIQDMEPLPDILSSTAWLLKDGGRLVILMLHPCFRIPRQSGWGWDDGRSLQYRRVDSYLSPLSVPVRPIAKGKPGSIMAYHLPLHEYVNGLVDAGFRIERIVEVPAYPGISRKGKRAKAENRANGEIPLFLAIKAIRI